MRIDLRGSRVLITGASSGIGEAIGREIAPKASTLILVARRKDRLEKLRDELIHRHPKLRVELEPCDLTDLSAVKSLAARVKDVDVLVNNAGVGSFGLYESSSWDYVEKMIQLNITTLSYLTRAFLPGMVARGRGGILNLSSGWGLAWAPGFAPYAATKHYVTAFSECLRSELRGAGVGVTQVCPGPVATEFEAKIENTTSLSMPPSFALSAKACAREAVRGLERGKALVKPGWAMKFLLPVAGFLPRPLIRAVYLPLGSVIRSKASITASRSPTSR